MNTPAATPPVPRRVLITGATGLLGSNITTMLLAAGAEVTALVRSRERASRLLPAHQRLRLLEGDITRVSGFAAQLRGTDAIIHTAAYFREYYQPGGNDPARLRSVNVDAVEQLLRAAADAGVPALVHISSATTVGTRADGQPSDEDTPPDPGWERNGYRASKVDAELLIQAWPGDGGIRVPIIVPAWIWGPGDAAPTASGRLFLAVAKGEMSAIPRAGSQIVDARDVAAAAITAITHGAHARRYIIAGSWQPLPAITREIAAATGAAAPRQVPSALAMAGATVIELTARLRHRDPPVTRTGTRVLLEGNRQHLSSQRAERELNATFRPLAQTITDEADWYHDHGMLPDRAPNTRSAQPAKAPARHSRTPGTQDLKSADK
jgi:nucleoside-diphosphate-sugar epimerase